MKVLVTGGAGFLGSHLCDLLIARNHTVVCLDDLSSGYRANIEHLSRSREFSFVEASVLHPVDIEGSYDGVVHLASLASPPAYLSRPIFTLRTGAEGTRNVLDFAKAKSARFILASSSEVYGEPFVHPQPEDYWGNVNPVGPRSVYDEAKRYSEALTTAYRTSCGTNTGIVRIFNTYGPRMRPEDGRVVSNFITRALNFEPLTVFGSGTQTRSLCYVDDLVRGILAMLDSDEPGPINLGNPAEMSILDLAELVLELVGSPSRIELHPLPQDDPTRRRPDITRAIDRLGWKPRIPVREGIVRTIEWHVKQFRREPSTLEVSSEPPVLDVRHLTKTFGKFRAVDDVSFSVSRGEILGLVGPNGAGKTTIAQMLSGLVTPSAGAFSFFGRSLDKDREYILQRINFTSPNSNAGLPPRLTVRENLAVFARIYDVRNPEQKIGELLDQFAIGALRNKPMSRLSSGEAARVGLCKAFLNDPELLLLDEPTVYLDPLIALEVRETLLDFQRNRGTSILYTSHNMHEVERMCGRIVFLSRGRVIACGTPVEVTRNILAEHREEPALEEIFIEVGRQQRHASP